MATKRQIASNRRNGAKSSGPRTDQGKAVSRMNALKFGIDATSTLIRDESPSEFLATMDALFAEHQPVTPTEQGLVSLLGHSLWRIHRLLNVEGQVWEAFMLQAEEDYSDFQANPLGVTYAATNQFPRIERHITSLRRTVHQCLDELRRLRADSAGQGLEPSTEVEDLVLPQTLETVPQACSEISPQTHEPTTASPQIGFVPQNPVPDPVPPPEAAPQAAPEAQPPVHSPVQISKGINSIYDSSRGPLGPPIGPGLSGPPQPPASICSRERDGGPHVRQRGCSVVHQIHR